MIFNMKQYFTSPCKKASPIEAYSPYNPKLGQLQVFLCLTSSLFEQDTEMALPIISLETNKAGSFSSSNFQVTVLMRFAGG